MKSLRNLRPFAGLTGVCVLVFGIFSSQAQTLNLNYGYVSKRGQGTTNAEVIFPAGDNVIVRLTSLDTTNDVANSIIKLQAGTYGAVLTNSAASTATNVSLYGNSFIVAGDTVVFQKADKTVFSALVDTTNGVQLTFAAQIGTAVAAGDTVYRMGLTQTNLVGAGTLRKDGPAIYAAPVSKPLRILSFGGSAVSAINATAAYGAIPQY